MTKLKLKDVETIKLYVPKYLDTDLEFKIALRQLCNKYYHTEDGDKLNLTRLLREEAYTHEEFSSFLRDDF